MHLQQLSSRTMRPRRIRSSQISSGPSATTTSSSRETALFEPFTAMPGLRRHPAAYSTRDDAARVRALCHVRNRRSLLVDLRRYAACHSDATRELLRQRGTCRTIGATAAARLRARRRRCAEIRHRGARRDRYQPAAVDSHLARGQPGRRARQWHGHPLFGWRSLSGRVDRLTPM